MIFALLTLLAALSLAAISGWFSIVGVTSIYAGAVIPALVLGAGIELGKLVMISWLYRSWKTSNWLLKGPILVLVVSIMIATSMSVFGFLSKAHLQQGEATLDNGPKIERLNDQISREKSRIADDEKVISQLDSTVNSFIGKDNGDRALQVRRFQDNQRKQLRIDINSAQKNIDLLSTEKMPLESEVRKLQLDVGPIRYIAELFYGTENTEKNIESAVKLFSGLIVFILDPSAVMLLIAFNHTLLLRQNEKKANNKTSTEQSSSNLSSQSEVSNNSNVFAQKKTINREGDTEGTIHTEIPKEQIGEYTINEEEEIVPSEPQEEPGPISNSSGWTGQHEEGSSLVTGENDRIYEARTTVDDKIQSKRYSSEDVKEDEINEEDPILSVEENPVINTPEPTPGPTPEPAVPNLHFVPQKVRNFRAALRSQVPLVQTVKVDKYPRALSWLNEFERSQK